MSSRFCPVSDAPSAQTAGLPADVATFSAGFVTLQLLSFFFFFLCMFLRVPYSASFMMFSNHSVCLWPVSVRACDAKTSALYCPTDTSRAGSPYCILIQFVLAYCIRKGWWKRQNSCSHVIRGKKFLRPQGSDLWETMETQLLNKFSCDERWTHVGAVYVDGFFPVSSYRAATLLVATTTDMRRLMRTKYFWVSSIIKRFKKCY